jgi:hypothetical protein
MLVNPLILLDFKFSRQRLWSVLSSVLWRRVFCYKFIDVSEERTVSESLANFYQTTQPYTQGDGTLQMY